MNGLPAFAEMGKTLATARRAFVGGMLLFCAANATALAQGVTEESYGGRTLLVFVPSSLPAQGSRALVVVLHGGLGSAQRIERGNSENGLKMNVVAEKSGFVVAYLNGTPATRFLGPDKLGWNAGGGCCGQPAEKDIDDVGYVRSAIDRLVDRYGIDRSLVFGMGHSNGAMLIQRVMCETGIFSAAVSIAGPLNLGNGNCSAARGKRILAIHGEDDENVPIAGGRGSKGISRVSFNSEEWTRQSFVSSGAAYTLQAVKGADHTIARIDDAIQHAEGQSLAEKSARFFGLLPPSCPAPCPSRTGGDKIR